jgi:hypothetical protein
MPQLHISTNFHGFVLIILNRKLPASLSLGIEVLTSSGFSDSCGGLFPLSLASVSAEGISQSSPPARRCCVGYRKEAAILKRCIYKRDP